MNTDSAVALALIAILGTVVTALFKLLNANTKATADNTLALKDIATETAKGAREAKQRNGHLAELTIQSKTETLSAIAFIKQQHVDHQTVDHQTIKKGKK